MSATGTAREESQAMEFSVTKSPLLNELTTSIRPARQETQDGRMKNSKSVT